VLARAAGQQAEVERLLGDLARLDLAPARTAQAGVLSCAPLRALERPRAMNAVRTWLLDLGVPPPGHARLGQVVDSVLRARRDGQPCVAWSEAEIRRHGDRIHALRPLPPHDPDGVHSWAPGGPLELPAGILDARPVDGQGFRAGPGQRFEVRFRRGGERCRPVGAGHGRSLKKLLQEAGVPPWERGRIPLIYRDGDLAAVAGLWVCEGHAAVAGQPGWRITWTATTGAAQATVAAIVPTGGTPGPPSRRNE
jgi:tRNA(Ile)-lysidine synthase